ncbi:lamin-A-like isoform 2-T4 [Syngnathus typhle]
MERNAFKPLKRSWSFKRSCIPRVRPTMARPIIAVVDRDGNYVILRNKEDVDQNLGNWQVRHRIGSSAPIAFKFPAEFILKAGHSVTIWNHRNHNPPSDLVWETQADQFQTTLINANGEEMEMRKPTVTHLEDDDGNSASTVG